MEFPGLYKEFIDSGYLGSLDGVRHLDAYEEGRKLGRLNFESVVESRERREDVTDLVLLKLLPHNDTAGNRERGAWVHIAPATRGSVKRWFEGARWTRSEARGPRLHELVSKGPRLLLNEALKFTYLAQS
jgi:5-methylcytosine-specific restriction protein B